VRLEKIAKDLRKFII